MGLFGKKEEELVPETDAAKEEPKKTAKASGNSPSIYKGYDIRWLKSLGNEHADFNLVAEYEAQYGEIK